MSNLQRIDQTQRGYGNIYTPHAGSMIIQVQREGGLANRTIVLTERQVRLLRVASSKLGRALIAVVVASWVIFAVQSARVPLLSERIVSLERETQRIDTLQAHLSYMHNRYEQVRRMLGASTPRTNDAAQPTAGTPSSSATPVPKP